MNVSPILEKYGIDSKTGVNEAIYIIGLRVGDARNRLQEANKILASFGAPKIQKEDRVAELLAKGLIEQAVLHRNNFNFDEAWKIANQKYENIRITFPYGLISTEERQTAKGKVVRKSNDKKTRALEICEQNKTLSNAELAKLIQKDLKISFSNAYYYSSRVFKRSV